jgi:hypothetical protein
MVLLDTNIFIIDRFFPRDENYPVNKNFVERLPAMEAEFSIFSLFELCGISSFNLSAQELNRWMYQFDQVYDIQILEPPQLYISSAADWFKQFGVQLFDLFSRKMTWGDALLLHCAEAYKVRAIITWNTKHFTNRTMIPVLTPGET